MMQPQVSRLPVPHLSAPPVAYLQIVCSLPLFMASAATPVSGHRHRPYVGPPPLPWDIAAYIRPPLPPLPRYAAAAPTLGRHRTYLGTLRCHRRCL